MKILPVIDRLKAVSTTLGGRIAGAAEWSAAVEATRLTLPCAFVFRADDQASEAATVGKVVQMLVEEFAIVVAVSNSADERGQAASESLDDVRADLLTALLGWEPDATHNAMEYGGGSHVGIDRGRLWHQFIFRTSSAISS